MKEKRRLSYDESSDIDNNINKFKNILDNNSNGNYSPEQLNRFYTSDSCRLSKYRKISYSADIHYRSSRRSRWKNSADQVFVRHWNFSHDCLFFFTKRFVKSGCEFANDNLITWTTLGGKLTTTRLELQN